MEGVIKNRVQLKHGTSLIGNQGQD
ncbi:hypothetical protein ED562_15730 [Microcystis aeruginosa FACHB-524]|nr:hypothetical protein ED562_15730 [Microcystis aeruginosa FACHB-524]